MRKAYIPILSLLFSNYVTLGKSLNFSRPQFYHLEIDLIEFLRKLNELMHTYFILAQWSIQCVQTSITVINIIITLELNSCRHRVFKN